jgi:hypothetical protein
MNPWIIILIVIVVILTITIITLLIIGQIEYSKKSSNITIPLCTETANINLLLQLNFLYDCKVDGKTGTYYYIGDVEKNDFVVSKIITSPINVCSKYCKNLVEGVCSGPSYKNLTAQQNFDTCMTQLHPKTCVPPLPLAAKGADFYYAYAPTNAICERIL